MWLETRIGETALLLGFLLLAAGLAFWVIPAGIAPPRGTAAVTPRSVPFAVTAGIGVLCLMRLAALWLLPARPEAGDADDGAAFAADEDDTRHPWRLAAIVALCLLLAPVLIPQTGFYVSTVVFMVAVMWLLGERRPVVLAGTPLALAGAIYALFELGFSIRLPKGALSAALPGF